jgi:tripartite-type tricarboxylate transporter receptor subunit TctC
MRAILVALTGLLLFSPAQAQYPNKPIRLLLPNPPGGATDAVGRLMAAKTSERLGQPIVVENRPGANGNQATEAVGKAVPDGYLMLFGADSQIVISPHVYQMTVDTLKDLTPISSLTSSVMMLTVVPSLPVKSLSDFLDYARKAKAPIPYGSIGNGSQHHLAMEMIKMRSGVDMLHVPYKGGGPATVAMLAGDIQAMWGGNSVSSFIKSGKLRLLAVGSRQRLPEYPDVPAINETIPGFEVRPWHGLFFPAGVPAPILGRMRTELAQVLNSPDTKATVDKLGGLQLFVTSPDEFATLLRADHARYGEVVKAVGVKVD